MRGVIGPCRRNNGPISITTRLLRRSLAMRLLPSSCAKLAWSLADFFSEETRKVRGVRKAKPKGDLLNRHVPENEVALCLSDNACVDHFRWALLRGGRTGGTQLHQRHCHHRCIVLQWQVLPEMFINQLPESFYLANIVTYRAFVSSPVQTCFTNQHEQKRCE